MSRVELDVVDLPKISRTPRQLSQRILAMNFADLLANVLATIVGVAVLYLIFVPRVKLGKNIMMADAKDADPVKFNCSYFNRGPLPVYDVKVKVWIRVLDPGDGSHEQRAQLVEVPVDDPEIPLLGRKFKPGRSRPLRQLPRLMLGEVDWSEVPADFRPTDPFQLKEFLRAANAKLYLHVTATTNIGQITKVFVRSYCAGDVESCTDHLDS